MCWLIIGAVAHYTVYAVALCTVDEVARICGGTLQVRWLNYVMRLIINARTLYRCVGSL
jgi:hypothetical protein